jgi:chaperone required for assembly of F1-ATPase
MSFIPQRNGKPLTTPKGVPLAVPTEKLAKAIEAEWADVKGIVPKRGQIPLTQHANTALDHITAAPEAALGGFLSHAQSDLLCYRATDPKDLVQRQGERWQPWLDWIRGETGADFAVFSGLMPQKQKPEALEALRQATQALDPFHLLVLSQAAGLTGSAVLAYAFYKRQLDYVELMEYALLDELFQSEQWGEPEELKQQREDLRLELAQLSQFMNLL